MTDEIKLVKVEYWREVKKPTLAQFLYRRAVKEKMASIKGRTGVTSNPSTGLLLPVSALAAKEALNGLTAEKIAKEHPNWVDEYNKEHGKGE